MDKQYGKIARKFMDASLENQVLKSARGFYIGTEDPNAGPVSRESEEYWQSQEKAVQAFQPGHWTQRREP